MSYVEFLKILIDWNEIWIYEKHFCNIWLVSTYGFIIALLNLLRLQEGLSEIDVQRTEYGGFN